MVSAKCRGTPVEQWVRWESDNRGSGQRDAVDEACRGCPVARECAAYGLATGPAGMVWAGVPVPEMPNTIYWARAIERLQAIANGWTDLW